MTHTPSSGSPHGLKSVALRNAIYTVLARSSGVLVAIILTPFVLGKLGRELYGIIFAATSAFDYLLLLRGGIGAAMRRHVTFLIHSGNAEQAKEHYRAGFWLGNAATVVIVLLTVFFAGPFCRFLRLPEALVPDGSVGIILIAGALAVSIVTGTFEVPIYSTGRLYKIQAVSALGPWVRLAVVFAAFHYLVPSLTNYGGSLLVAEIPAMLLLGWMAQRTGTVGAAVPKPGLANREVRKEMLSYGGVAVLAQVAALLYISTDNMLIGRIYGPAAVTHYSLGVRWEPIVRSFLWTPIVALAPLFTQLEAHAQNGRSLSAVRRSIALATTLAVPFCFVPCILGDLFLVHWVGAEYRDSAKYLIAMLAPASLTISLAPVWAALVGRGRIGWVAVGELVVAVLNVGVSLLLAIVFRLELLGFALGNTFAMLAKNLILIPMAAGHEQIVPSTRDLLLPLPRALAGGAPGLIALFLLRDLYGVGLLSVVVAGVLGGIVALTGSALTTLGRREIKALLEPLFPAGAGTDR